MMAVTMATGTQPPSRPRRPKRQGRKVRGAQTCPLGPNFRRKRLPFSIALFLLHAPAPLLGTLYGASTTTMAAATLLRATPLFSGEGAGRAMAARVHVGVVGSCRAQIRAVTPGICPGRSRRRPGTTIAGSFAAAEGSGTARLVPWPGCGGQEDLCA